jgi:predicted phosphoribosyltransferase
VPGHEELAMGAIASGGVVVWNNDVLESLRIAPDRRDAVVARERAELERREREYRGDHGPIRVRDCVTIVVDDGLATGATMAAAIAALKLDEPRRIVVAVPVAPRAAIDALRTEVDDVVSVIVADRFGSVGEWYDDFRATTDGQVVSLLRDGGGE